MQHHDHVGVVLERLEVARLLVAAVADLVRVPDEVDRQPPGELDRVVGRGVVDEDHLVDRVLRDPGERVLERRGGLPGGHDDDHLGGREIRHGGPQRRRCRTGAARPRPRRPPARPGSSAAPAATAASAPPAPQHRLARLRAAQRRVEVEVAGQRADEAVEPADHDLPAAGARDALDPQPGAREPGEQRARREVDEVARRVEVQPAVAEDPRLEAARVGHRDDEHAAGREQPRGVAHGVPGVRQVLERVPEHDRGPFAADRRRAARRGRRGGRPRARARPPRGPGAPGRRSACRRRRRRRAPGRAARSRRAGRRGGRACGAAARRPRR